VVSFERRKIAVIFVEMEVPEWAENASKTG
jgi:hypothetical protein